MENHDLVSGKIVLIRRCILPTCPCNFEEKALAALNSGAVGVVFVNDREDAVLPITAGSDGAFNQTTLPVCMVTYTDGETVIDAISSSSSSFPSPQISFSDLYPPSLPVFGDNTLITYIDVLSPWALKWRHPASVCRWNPDRTDTQAQAGDVVQADFEVKCTVAGSCAGQSGQGLRNCCRTRGCYTTSLTNPAEVSGEIALFSIRTGDDRECHTYQELSAAAQIAGAVGALIPYYERQNSLPLFVNPEALPFDYQIDTYVIPSGTADEEVAHLEDETGDKKVSVKLPPTIDGWGETYFPHPDTYGALPQAVIALKGSAALAGGVGPEFESFEVGQAKFNPLGSSPVRAQVVRGEVAEACWDAAGTAGKEGSGTDCDLCHELLDDHGGAIANGAELAGKVAFVEARETFCLNEWEALVDSVEAHGAVGLIVGNEFQYTYTMVDSQRDVVAIPVFNAPLSVGSRISEMLGDGETVTAKLPGIRGDGSGAFNTTSHVTAATDNESLTQIKIKEPKSFGDAAWEAGQADFNTEFTAGVFSVENAAWFDGCNSLASCHLCNLLESPLILSSPGLLDGRIALIDIEEVQCFLPVSNAAKLVQDAGAAAALFINKNDEIVTLSGGRETDGGLTIPSFLVGRSWGQKLAVLRAAQTEVRVQLPPISGLTNLAPITIEPEGGIEEENVANDSNGKGQSTNQSRARASKVGVTASIVLLCLIVVFIGGRQVQKRRKRARNVEMYDQLTTGTQFESPMTVGLGNLGANSAGASINGGGGDVEIVFAGAPTPASAPPPVQQAVVLTARPWVTAAFASGDGWGGSQGDEEEAGESAASGGGVASGGGGEDAGALDFRALRAGEGTGLEMQAAEPGGGGFERRRQNQAPVFAAPGGGARAALAPTGASELQEVSLDGEGNKEGDGAADGDGEFDYGIGDSPPPATISRHPRVSYKDEGEDGTL